MLVRENRMIDANINSSLQNGAAFFASTSIFALGGLIAILGASEQAMAFFGEAAGRATGLAERLAAEGADDDRHPGLRLFQIRLVVPAL